MWKIYPLQDILCKICSGINCKTVQKWFIPTMIKGYRKELTEEDLFETAANQKSKYLGDLLENEWEREKSNSTPSLIRAIWKAFTPEIITNGVIGLIIELVMKSGQCLSFIMLIRYFSEGMRTAPKNDVYMHAITLTCCNFFIVIGTHIRIFGMQTVGMQIRVACCTLIYRKSLKLSRSSMGNITIGQLINLVTNDVSRFDYAIHLMHMILIAPIELWVIMVILYLHTGWTGLIGLGIFVLAIPLQILVGRKISILRQKTAKITDERIKAMSEIIYGIQVIKMYTWEKHFTQVINKIRRSEVRFLRWTAFWITLITGSNNFIPKLGLFASIIAYILMGYTLTPIHVFSMVILYNSLKVPLNMVFPVALYRCAELGTSVKRIRAFLLLDELQIPKSVVEQASHPQCNEMDVSVELQNTSAKWIKESFENTLEDVNITIHNQKLVAVIGQVGSGKSSLLKLIMNEIHLCCGKMHINGTISYSSQEGWFFRGTIKENIVFGDPYNEERYKNVLKVCALEKDLLLFPHGDLTIITKNGANLSGGQRTRVNLARAVYRQANIYLLDDPLSAVDVNVGEFIFDQCISKFLKNKCVILVTNQLQFLRYVDHIYVLQDGKIYTNGTYQHLLKERLDLLKIPVGDDNKEIKDKYFTGEEYDPGEKLKEYETVEHCGEGAVGLKVYKRYLQAGGSIYVHLVIILGILAYGFFTTSFDGALGYWSNIDYLMVSNNGTSIDTALTRTDYLIIFCGIMAFLIIFSTFSALSCALILVNSAKNIHTGTFSKIIRAPMQFFHKNSSGRILNRLSKDMGLLDDYLPAVVPEIVTVGIVLTVLYLSVTIIGILVVVEITNYWLSAVMILALIFLYVLGKVYFPCSTAIKRLEGLTRSPIYTHIRDSFKGLETIRTFKKQPECNKLYYNLQDVHTSSFFMYLASIHTFGTLVDILCVLLIFFVTFAFILIEESTAGIAALAISQSIALLSIIQWSIRQSCEATLTMTSAERLMEYLELEDDESDNKRDVIPNESWPERGEIEFKRTCLRYKPTDELVLKNISFKIERFRKVGVVGRTGAGKSSLSLALFQLAYTDGFIFIDDIDIRRIPLQNLRSKISIIPQEPLLFTDTIRKNLDPFDQFDDTDLWNALADVELKDVVKEMPDGLMTKISEGGSNLSMGQRQLVCLARAIIQRNKILILDEATANVDPKTDTLIQSTIRKKFNNCTVITIAHRLHTIIDNDLILLLEAGEVKEFDRPYKLLQKKGLFYEMVEKTGETMAKALHQIALDVHNNTVIEMVDSYR